MTLFDKDLLDVVLKCTQLIGIPVAIWLYFVNKRKERLDREYGTYDALDDKYIEYQKLCLQHPDLDVGDTPKRVPPTLDADQLDRQLIMLTILVSILERAFLMYRDKSLRVRKAQWDGWAAYIADWCRRPNFVEALPDLKQQFDSSFIAYLEGLASQHRGSSG